METKQVIIQNRDEERQFQEIAEVLGFVWDSSGSKPSEFKPSTNGWFRSFPYCITINDNRISWQRDFITQMSLTKFLESE